MVELPELVLAAKNARLSEPEIRAEIPAEPFDVIFTAGVLQCTDDPFSHIDRLLALDAPYILLTRNFLSEEPRYFRHDAPLFANGAGPVPQHFIDQPKHFFFQSLPLYQLRKRIDEKYEVLFEVTNESGMAHTGPGLYGIDYFCRLREGNAQDLRA